MHTKMSTFSSSSKKNWDKLGVFASLFCAIHCLSAPLLFIFLPAFAEIWGHRSSHIIIALLVLPLASTVLFRGYRQHRRRWILITTVIGITAVLASCMLPYLATASGESDVCCPQIVTDDSDNLVLQFPPASLAAILGSVFLVISHTGNFVCCKKCLSPSENCCN
jgi:hypothetical protein